jgi:hypothetical protein
MPTGNLVGIDRPLTPRRQSPPVPLLLIPLDDALPAVQAYLVGRTEEPLSPGDAEAAAELLERCVRTGEALVAFALRVGRPATN